MTGQPETGVTVCLPGGDLLRSYTITYAARPWTLNRERAGHWRVHRQATDLWRQVFGQLAGDRRVPRFKACVIEVSVTVNRPPVADTGACIGAAKAAVDGLVDAGRLPDDGPTVVRMLTFHAPTRTGHDSLTLTVREVEP
jgi:hypothetical protein